MRIQDYLIGLINKEIKEEAITPMENLLRDRVDLLQDRVDLLQDRIDRDERRIQSICKHDKTNRYSSVDTIFDDDYYKTCNICGLTVLISQKEYTKHTIKKAKQRLKELKRNKQ